METPNPSGRSHGSQERDSRTTAGHRPPPRPGASSGGGGHRGAEPRWTEHLMLAADAFAREMRGYVPGEFSEHARGSMREALLAIRSLLDAGIERFEQDERKSAARKIEVE